MSFSTRQLVPIKDAIFADVVESSRLAHDQKLLQLLQSAYSPESPLYRDVCLQVDQLGLLPFQTEQEAPKKAEETDSKKRETTSELLVLSAEVPHLTKNERRLSFELMHYIPNPTLVKPAETGVSSVNVVTKVTDLETNGYIPTKPTKNALTDKIKRYLGRLQLLNQNRQQRELEAKNRPIPAPLVVNQTSRGNEIAPIGAARRLSVVGQNLPLYIKSQLELKEEVGAEGYKGPEVTGGALAASNEDIYSRSSSMPPKMKDTRIHNLLANLESLYFHHDGNSTGETSFGSNTNNESTISDADREYMLPNSFTQWNVRVRDTDGLHPYQSSLEESANENTDDDEEDDDDEYLFQVK